MLTRAAAVLGLMRLWFSRARLAPVEALVAALLVDHLAQLALMSLLSLPGALTMINYRLAYGGFAVALVVAARCAPGDVSLRALWTEYRCRVRKVHLPVLVLGVMALGLVLVRAAFFFDTTYDSLTYSLTKLGFYAQNQSVFYLSGLSDLRIDAYERNGELAFLHHLLITGDTRWLALGGVDAWLLLLAAFLFLLRVLGVSRALALATSLFVTLCPIVFGLSGVTKGDALAAGCLVAATGWLLRGTGAGFSQARFALFACALALAVTAKLSAAFAAVGLAALFVTLLARKRHWPQLVTCVLIAFVALVCFAKAMQNVMVYRNPFQRTSLEEQSGGFSLRNLQDGLTGGLRWFLGGKPDSLPWGHHSDLEKGMGLAGLAAVLLLGGALVWGKRAGPAGSGLAARAPALLTGVVLIGCTVVLLARVPWRGEGFAGNAMRYLLPYALPLVGLLFAFAFTRLRGSVGLLIAVTALGAYHWLCDTNASSTMSHLGRSDLIRRVLHYDKFAARFGYYFKQLGSPEIIQQVRAEQATAMPVLVIPQQSDLPLFWLFGNNLNWRVTALREGIPAVGSLERANTSRAVVSWRLGEAKVEPRLAEALQQTGWVPGPRCGLWAAYQRGAVGR